MDATQLTYFVGPNLVYCTRPNGESVVNLIISASNITGTGNEAILVKEITLKVPMGLKVNELAKDYSMNPVSLQERQWEFKKNKEDYLARPIVAGTKLAPGESITFELRNIKVNLLPGTAVIEIVEVDGEDKERAVFFPVNKIKSTLEIDSFKADVAQVASGEPATLIWQTTAAANVTLFPREQSGDLPVNGSLVVRPLQTTTYTLTANGADPAVSWQVTVMVLPPKINSFEPDNTRVNAGETVTLSWNVSNADQISISPGYEHEALAPVGSKEVTPDATTTYILTARNKALQTVDQHEVVSIKPAAITKFASAQEGAVPGTTVELNWETQSAVSAYITPGGYNISREQLKAGKCRLTVPHDTEFSLVAQNSLGATVRAASVPVFKDGWHTVTKDAPFKYEGATFPPVTLNFDNKIWVFHPKLGTIYKSANGQEWPQVYPPSGWPMERRDNVMSCVFNGMMWLMGGSKQEEPLKCFNDVFATKDCMMWYVGDTPGWAGRRSSSCFALNNKMFVSGGVLVQQNPVALNDVWSTTNGNIWVKETDKAFEGPRFSHQTVVANNKAWAICNESSVEVYSSTNGKDWVRQAEQIPSSPHTPMECCVVNYEIYVAFTDFQNRNTRLYRMDKSEKWTELSIPSEYKQLGTRLLGFKNMLWSFLTLFPEQQNCNVVAYIP